jgi:hypothetical protein
VVIGDFVIFVAVPSTGGTCRRGIHSSTADG